MSVVETDNIGLIPWQLDPDLDYIRLPATSVSCSKTQSAGRRSVVFFCFI